MLQVLLRTMSQQSLVPGQLLEVASHDFKIACFSNTQTIYFNFPLNTFFS